MDNRHWDGICRCSNSAISAKTAMGRPPGIPLNEGFQAEIHKAMKRLRISSEDLARELNIAESTFDDYLSRDSRRIPPKKFKLLCHKLQITPPPDLANPVRSRKTGSRLPNWQNARVASKHREDCSISENLAAYQDSIHKKDGRSAHLIAYGLADDYRLIGDYSSSLSWLGICESHIGQFAGDKYDVRLLRQLKVEFKRTLVRDFICLGSLYQAMDSYRDIIRRIEASREVHANGVAEFEQLILNCHRQLAEIDRLQGNYAGAKASFLRLHEAYGRYYDSPAQKYCKLGQIECDRMLDDPNVVDQIDDLRRIQSDSENLRLQARLHRIRFQAMRWRASTAGDQGGLMAMEESKLLDELDLSAREHHNQVARLYLALEQISLHLELYGRGIKKMPIPQRLFESVQLIREKCASPRSSLPMEAAHSSLLLAEAHLIDGNRERSLEHLGFASSYYEFSGLRSGIVRVQLAQAILNYRANTKMKSSRLEGIDLSYFELSSSSKNWCGSLSANLP